MNSIVFIFIIHLTSTAIMAGLIWTIQLLHYPFFHYLDEDHFTDLMQIHRTRTAFIVIPVMLTELFTGIYLMSYSPEFKNWFLAGFGMIILIWLSTFFLQLPPA